MTYDLEKITLGKTLTDSEMSVLIYLLDHIDSDLKIGVRGVAKENFTSTSTVMRLARKLGYNGFIDMYYKLLANIKTSEEKIEEENAFLSQIEAPVQITYEQYTAIKKTSEMIAETKQIIFVYGTGFMGTVAEYFAKKLLGIGVKVIYSNGADSIAEFENNLEDIGLLILFSRSGRSGYVCNRAQLAKENGVSSIAFTGAGENTISTLSDVLIQVNDDKPFDDRNQKPTLFYTRIMCMIELTIYEYEKYCTNGD